MEMEVIGMAVVLMDRQVIGIVIWVYLFGAKVEVKVEMSLQIM